MSNTGKSAAARAKGTAATTGTEAATAATCVEAATSTVPAEPSAARLGTPYRNGKRKEGKRDNAQVFRYRTLPHFLNPVDDSTGSSWQPKTFH